MAFSKISHHIEQLNHNIQAFAKAKLEYYELKILKKATRKASKLVNALIFGFVFFMILLFVSVGCAILIGQEMDDLYLGFFIVAGGYFILFLCFLLFGRHFVKKRLLKSISRKMAKKSLFKEKK